MSRLLWPLLLVAALLAAGSGTSDAALHSALRHARHVAHSLQPDVAHGDAARALSIEAAHGPAETEQAHELNDKVLLHLRSAQRTEAEAEAEGQSGAELSGPPAAYQSAWLWQGPGLQSLRQDHAAAYGFVAPAMVNGVVKVGDFEFVISPPAASGTLPVGHRELQRVWLVRGLVAPQVGGGMATDTQWADSFADAVYFADFRASRATAKAGQIGRSAGLLIPPSLGNHADFNRLAVNFIVQSDQQYVYDAQVRTARALQDVLTDNLAWPRCRVQVEIQLTYPTLPAAFDKPRYIPSGGRFRITAPKATCGDYVELSRRMNVYKQQADAADVSKSGVMKAAHAAAWAWYLAATRKVNGQMAGWTAQTGLASETQWNNPEADRKDGYAYNTNRAAPPVWASAWLMQSGPTLSEPRARQGINNVGNQPWVAVVPPALTVTVGGTGHSGSANQGAFTYTLDAAFHRVTRVQGEAWASDVGSDTDFGGKAICNVMYFADFRHERQTLLANHVGRTAGHIVAPSIAGPVTGGASVAGASIFNQHPINFFPQAETSNSGLTSTYNHMESGVQGLMTTVAGMAAAGVAGFGTCHPIVTIDFTYGNQVTSSRYIPTGGSYSVSIPKADCGNVASLDALIQAIRAYNIVGAGDPANLARSRKSNALQWLHPRRAVRDDQAAVVAERLAAVNAATLARTPLENAWALLPGTEKNKKALHSGAWTNLVTARNLVNQRTQSLNAAQLALAPLAAAVTAEANLEVTGTFATGFNARARDDTHGNLVKTVTWTNP